MESTFPARGILARGTVDRGHDHPHALAVALVNIKNARINAAEVIVAREMQTVHQAQLQYMSQFGTYAATLAQLGPAPGRAGTPQAAGLIPASLASGEKNGYLFTLAVTSGGFTVSAVPRVFGSTGRRTFYLDDDGVIHQNWGAEPATAASPKLK